MPVAHERAHELRVASLIGTARPRPMPATAVLIPMTRPSPSASAPPELPGLRAASVWMTLSTIRPGRVEGSGPGRHHARRDGASEAVRIPDRDDELADAQALGVAERGRGQAVASARSTARSESGSAPMSSALNSWPSTNDARTARRARSTTCADVNMKPSVVITTPLPPPSTLRPPRSWRDTRRFATGGASCSATALMVRE